MKKKLNPKKTKDKSLSEEIDDFIISWNNRFPIDYWWRKKYKVAFGSEEHRKVDFITMYIDYREEKLMKAALEKGKSNDSETERLVDQLIAKGKKTEVVKMSKNEIDHEFDNLDLSKM